MLKTGTLTNDLSISREAFAQLDDKAKIDHRVALELGMRAAAGPVFAKATPETVAAFAERNPQHYDELRERVSTELQAAGWLTLAAEPEITVQLLPEVLSEAA